MGTTLYKAETKGRRLGNRLFELVGGLRRWAGGHRMALLVASIALFTGGLAYSIATLELDWRDLHLVPLLVLVFALSPVTIVYSAVNMQLMARSIGVQVGFWHGIRVSAYAQVAELLPLPGGAIVRTAALIERGGTTGRSAGIVVAFAVLWIACAALGGGIALWSIGLVGILLALAGTLAILMITTWIANTAGWKVAVAALGLRTFGLALVAVRILVAFLVIGVMIGGVDAFAFAFAIVLGSAASLVPAGLGIGEGLSALMAGPTGLATAAAFTAAAINRLAGFAVNMLVAGLAALFSHDPIAPSDEGNV